MRTVVAEIVRYKMLRKDGQQQVEISVWFRCPKCGRRHSHREIFTPPHNFDEPARTHRCGAYITVSMPWAFAAARAQTKKFEYRGVLIINGKPVTEK